MSDRGAKDKIGLVLTGGGARAAYQVGVVQALAHILPRSVATPFKVLSGTSAGAINAAALAVHASDFRHGVRQLLNVWKNMHVRDVYRGDLAGIAVCGARWLAALMLGGLGKRNPVSLLDNRPLADLLARHFDFDEMRRAIDAGDLTALAVTASGYTSGESISFFEGQEDIGNWRRARRIGVRSQIGVPHLMASAAIPFMFPPVKIHREFFGDGSMRQMAPISPALHLGANRIIVVTVAGSAKGKVKRIAADDCPSLAEIAGHSLNSIFLDSLEADIERLERINRTVSLLEETGHDIQTLPLQRVDCLVLSPSEELEQIAMRHVSALPRPVRFFMRGIGAMRRSGSNLASYFLFERPYCRALINLGFRDTMARRDEVLKFMEGGTRVPARKVQHQIQA